MPKVPTFAGRRPAKKGNEWVERFNATVTGYEEERAACKKKGIKFDMTKHQYWDMVVHRGSGLIVCLPVGAATLVLHCLGNGSVTSFQIWFPEVVCNNLHHQVSKSDFSWLP